MKLIPSLLLLGIVISRAEGPIQSAALDPGKATVVPVATNRATTLTFPGPLHAIDGGGVTTDPKTEGSFLLAHTKGSSFLSLRALNGGGSGNLNIRLNDQTYVFLLEESSNPILALHLELPANKVLPPPRLSPTGLLSLLDKAKAYPLLRTQHAGVVNDTEFRSFPTNITTFDGFEVQLEEVHRFNVEDTLIFRATIRNLGGEVFHYEPGSFAVRVGSRIYPASISDASGRVPPHGEEVVYFAITGSPDGGRADLSIKNQFQVLLTRAQESLP